jgi:hypothetical protein
MRGEDQLKPGLFGRKYVAACGDRWRGTVLAADFKLNVIESKR